MGERLGSSYSGSIQRLSTNGQTTGQRTSATNPIDDQETIGPYLEDGWTEHPLHRRFQEEAQHHNNIERRAGFGTNRMAKGINPKE